jgi:rod shape-determining protein MreD
MLIFYLLLTAVLFFLQNFLPLPLPWRLDLLTLGLIFVSLRTSLLIAVSLAMVWGLALDCYGTAPLGVQAGMFLVAVVGVKILRRHINFLYIFPQIVGVAAITLVQTALAALLLHLLMPVPVLYPGVMRESILQVGVTALSAPVFLAWFDWLAKLWRRWFYY